MLAVILVIHLLIAIALIVLILLQKTEGGAMGGGFSVTASVNSMMQPRARANPITRATTFLGICFFATSIGLALLAQPSSRTESFFTPTADGPAIPSIDENLGAPAPETPTAPTVPAPNGESSVPQVPVTPQD